MPAAVSTALKSSIAIAGASIIAVSPLIPTQNVHVPTVTLPAIELSGLPIPAFGAIPYQIGVNTIGNLLALAPVLIGSTKQCAVCLGPDPIPSPDRPAAGPPSPAGATRHWRRPDHQPDRRSSVRSAKGDNVAQALGVALLASPVADHQHLEPLGRSRAPSGGFALQAVLDRAFHASKDSIDGLINVLAQALVTGPVEVIGGAVTGATAFAGALAQTADFVTAFNAGRAPFEASVTTALSDLTTEVGKNRAIVYADLTAGPGVATSPVPIIAATRGAARPAASAAAVTKVKAGPAPTAASESGSSASSPTGHSSGTSKAHKAG